MAGPILLPGGGKGKQPKAPAQPAEQDKIPEEQDVFCPIRSKVELVPAATPLGTMGLQMHDLRRPCRSDCALFVKDEHTGAGGCALTKLVGAL